MPREIGLKFLKNRRFVVRDGAGNKIDRIPEQPDLPRPKTVRIGQDRVVANFSELSDEVVCRPAATWNWAGTVQARVRLGGDDRLSLPIYAETVTRAQQEGEGWTATPTDGPLRVRPER